MTNDNKPYTAWLITLVVNFIFLVIPIVLIGLFVHGVLFLIQFFPIFAINISFHILIIACYSGLVFYPYIFQIVIDCTKIWRQFALNSPDIKLPWQKGIRYFGDYYIIRFLSMLLMAFASISPMLTAELIYFIFNTLLLRTLDLYQFVSITQQDMIIRQKVHFALHSISTAMLALLLALILFILAGAINIFYLHRLGSTTLRIRDELIRGKKAINTERQRVKEAISAFIEKIKETEEALQKPKAEVNKLSQGNSAMKYLHYLNQLFRLSIQAYDFEPTVRIAAVQSMRASNDIRMTSILINRLHKDTSPIVREEAAYILGNLIYGTTSETDTRELVIKSLKECLSHESDSNVQKEILNALENAGETS